MIWIKSETMSVTRESIIGDSFRFICLFCFVIVAMKEECLVRGTTFISLIEVIYGILLRSFHIHITEYKKKIQLFIREILFSSLQYKFVVFFSKWVKKERESERKRERRRRSSSRGKSFQFFVLIQMCCLLFGSFDFWCTFLFQYWQLVVDFMFWFRTT